MKEFNPKVFVNKFEVFDFMKGIQYLVWLPMVVLLSGCMGAAALRVDETAARAERISQTITLEPPATSKPAATAIETNTPWSTDPHPLQIEVMRQQSYSGSPLTFEQTLEPGANYDRYIVSYLSDGYKIHALMTIPNETKPDTGWPVIVFNHGYITPSEYRTTERYVAYVDTIARHDYIVFKPDYRGHGDSEGDEVVGGGYGTPGYTDDILNAIASLKTYEDVDPNRIGMWGHSMGGQITLRAMVVSKDIRAGVIWGGVVAPYPEIIARWDYTKNPGLFPGMVISELSAPQSSTESWLRDFSGWVDEFSTKYGKPEQNPDFWATVSPNTYLADLSGPIQLHHSTTDEMVPLAWSEILADELKAAGQNYEFYTYEGDNHNISTNFSTAMQRTIAFFDKYVKGQ
ncbi:MAG: alpha/beta fold hydrolase [Anaerolineaceae bacterium]